MDENLKIDKKDVTALKVQVINQPEKVEIKDYEDAPEYMEIKVSKEEIQESEEE